MVLGKLSISPWLSFNAAGSTPGFNGVRWLQVTRQLSNARLEGSIKMWNDQKGFGFITPFDGGEDVFMHRSELTEGHTPEPGQPVTYEAIWDDRKQKMRAASVRPDASAMKSDGGAAPPPSRARDRPPRREEPSTPPKAHHIVGSWDNWAPSREAMEGPEGGPVRTCITVRKNAPDSPQKGAGKREEFQIVGDGQWNKRLYPAGPDKEEVIVLQPGGAASRAQCAGGKGHGRNWAVEGQPGSSFDVILDVEAQTVSCESRFSESNDGK